MGEKTQEEQIRERVRYLEVQIEHYERKLTDAKDELFELRHMLSNPINLEHRSIFEQENDG
jgi:chaperonin cofactor prefoldin